LSQLVQVGGSLLILAGFALAQWGVLNQKSPGYLVLNALGGAVLAADAVFGRQWGFLLLEGTWAVLATIGLAQLRRVPATPASNSPRD
jgi:hypothetical protein